MKSLDKEFNKSGYHYEIIHRIGDIALLTQSQPKGYLCSYEVVVVQKRKAELAFGRDYPAREAMPSNEEWGEHAWTFNELDRAQVKFNALVDAQVSAKLSNPELFA